jgi:hypothetical protein
MNAKGDKAMKGYKGFDNDLKCKGFQAVEAHEI